MSTARRVEQDNWDRPERDAWTARLIEAVRRAEKPVILVAHSVGVLTVAHAAPQLVGKVAGAFLVGASDWERPELKDKFGEDADELDVIEEMVKSQKNSVKNAFPTIPEDVLDGLNNTQLEAIRIFIQKEVAKENSEAKDEAGNVSAAAAKSKQ